MVKKRSSVLTTKGFFAGDEKNELTGGLFDLNTNKGFIVSITLDRLVPNPKQPRKTFYEQTISELAESIKQHGVLSPILVRPSGSKYEIIAGERRFKAAEQAGLNEVPAIIKDVSDGDARIISLIENIQREDLNDIDRAAALRELKVNLGLPWEKLAQRLGLTKSRVLDLVGLLGLPEEIQDDIRQKKLTEKHGRALRQLIDQDEVLTEVVSFVKDKNLTGDQSLHLVRAIKGQPGLTIEESYNTVEAGPPKAPRVKEDPIKAAILEADKLIKTLEEIKLNTLNKEGKENLHSKLLEVQNKIIAIMKSTES
jgi:ParB family chromosome partitioning protein